MVGESVPTSHLKSPANHPGRWSILLAGLITLVAIVLPPSPAAAAAGNINLYVKSGPVGTANTITGSGFTAGDKYTATFATTVIATGVIDSSGDVVADFFVPAYPGGKYAVTVTTASDNSNIEYFTITSEITVDVTSGQPGSEINVSGTGFKASSRVTILFDTVSLGSVTASASGAFSDATFTIPASAAGKHTIKGKDALGASPGIAFNTLQPEISLSEESGRVGEQISVSGLGFKPGSSVSILFDSAVIGTVTASASGGFSRAVVAIPPGSGGRHTMTGRDGINVSAGVDFEVTQSMTISPLSGAVGDTVNVTGAGFNRKSTVTVEFDAVPIQMDAVVDASGTFTGSFEVPEAAAGKHTIRVRDNSGNEDVVTFTAVPKLVITPESGAPASMVKAAGTGFAANAAVGMKYNGVAVVMSPESVATDSRGSFFATFEVPATLPGTYSVEASDMNQSASAKFTSVLSATISQITSEAAPGHVGMQLTISGAGFRPNAKIVVTRATIQEELASAVTDANGVFSIDFTIPPSPGGRHTVIVTDGVNTQEFEFYIEQDPPTPPLLLNPEKDQKAKQPVVFDWKDVSDTSGVTYRLQIARDEQFDSLFLEEELEDSEFTMTENELEPVTRDNPYYWRVKAVDGASNESEWSEIRPFSSGFVLTLPNGETELTLSAWRAYLAGLLVLSFAGLTFWLGRKTVRNRY